MQPVNILKAFLEQMRIKLSSVWSDITGGRGWRILGELAKGAQDPAKLAQLADPSVQCTPEQIQEALAGAAHLCAEERAVPWQFLDRIELFDRHIAAHEIGCWRLVWRDTRMP